MQRFDVIVLGGGIVGVSTARALSQGNAALCRPAQKVALVEAFSPGHSRGSSHGDGRIMRFTYPEMDYLELVQRAFPAWREIERRGDVRLIEHTGNWECGNPDSPIIAELDATLSAAGLPFERLTPAQSRRRFPQIHVQDDAEILYQPSGAVLRADLALRTLWRLSQQSSVELFTGRRVESVDVSQHGVQVRSGDLVLAAGALVVTAGAWSHGLLSSLGLELPLTAHREALAYFPARSEQSLSHRFDSLPVLIDYDDRDIFFALPQIDIPGVKVGRHRSGPETDPNLDPGSDPQLIQRLVEYVGRRFPHLDPQPLETLTCLYTNTPDFHFVLDHHPELPQVTIGTGFSGHGFKFGPVLGEILAQLANQRPSPVDLEAFRIRRFVGPPLKPRTGA